MFAIKEHYIVTAAKGKVQSFGNFWGAPFAPSRPNDTAAYCRNLPQFSAFAIYL
jgi:hypothetical protein